MHILLNYALAIIMPEQAGWDTHTLSKNAGKVALRRKATTLADMAH